MRIRSWRIAGVALLGLTMSACQLFYEPPTVRVADVRLVGVGIFGASTEVEFEVENPNRYDLTVIGLQYKIEFDDPMSGMSDSGEPIWSTLVEGTSREPVNLEGGAPTRMPISAPFRYEDVGRAMLSLIGSGEIHYRLSGEIRFDAPVGSFGVPFEEIGDFGGE